MCGGPLPPGRQRTTCSDRCRQAAWRRRHQTVTAAPEPVPAARSRKAGVVYECPACDVRQVGDQRCECGSFMRRLGRGGFCSSCDEILTVEELLAP
ncbi:MAG: hypothetical protein M3Y91_12975 [Actinomycetota bacterium]|nr:hypothetical protein [Actinomycetota bacterium]